MIPQQKKVLIAASTFIVVVAFCLPASSQVIQMVSHDGRTYACERSGLMDAGGFCGTQNYDVIVVGTILSVQPGSGREIGFALKPEEIFKGAEAQRIDVTTKQAVCFPDLRPGDRWLLYLQRDKESDALNLAYGSGSGPAAQERETVERLRRLSKFRGSGMIAGEVDISSGKPRVHHPIVARRLPGGAQYMVFTNKEGKFEFPPLPAGKYNLNANTVPGLTATWSGEITVEARQCTNYFFDVQVDGRISGLVRDADGAPLESVEVEAVPAEGSEGGGGTAVTDEKGHYEIRSLDAGRYFVGLRIADNEAGKGSLYAPGVKDRKRALNVNLGQAERRVGVNIRVPSEAGD
jgi:hypothetical protein